MAGEVVRSKVEMKTFRSLVMSALVIATIGSFAAPAFAHAAYKSSDPPDDGQVASPPGEVTATFTEPLANGSFLEITDPCGERVDGGDVRIVGYDMSVSMSGAAAGRYTVFFRAFSTLDPHVTEGIFDFTATSGEPCAGEEPPETAASGDGSGGAPSGGGQHPAGHSASGSSSTASGDSSSAAPSGKPAARAGSGSAPNRDRDGAGRNGSRTAESVGQQVDLAASEDGNETVPSVWEGIRLEPFLTGLLLAAIIGAAGGKVYAGIMGPRA
jgi:methionine-rich copper-binding protein CopC